MSVTYEPLVAKGFLLTNQTFGVSNVTLVKFLQSLNAPLFNPVRTLYKYNTFSLILRQKSLHSFLNPLHGSQFNVSALSARF